MRLKLYSDLITHFLMIYIGCDYSYLISKWKASDVSFSEK